MQRRANACQSMVLGYRLMSRLIGTASMV